jgi:hypothetical protein
MCLLISRSWFYRSQVALFCWTMTFFILGLITVFWRVLFSKTLLKYGSIVTFFFHVLLYGPGFFYFDSSLMLAGALKAFLISFGMFT